MCPRTASARHRSEAARPQPEPPHPAGARPDTPPPGTQPRNRSLSGPNNYRSPSRRWRTVECKCHGWRPYQHSSAQPIVRLGRVLLARCTSSCWQDRATVLQSAAVPVMTANTFPVSRIRRAIVPSGSVCALQFVSTQHSCLRLRPAYPLRRLVVLSFISTTESWRPPLPSGASTGRTSDTGVITAGEPHNRSSTGA